MKGYEALAAAFQGEGVKIVFGLMGDANMFWMNAMGEAGVRLVHVRHENSAVAMADGYESVTGEVGVCSVTCGPGLTQTPTALTTAVRRGCAMVMMAGDTPTAADQHLQSFNPEPLVRAAGATFLRVRNVNTLFADVRKAFYLARSERSVVVLSVPMDIQDQAYDGPAAYPPSSEAQVPSRAMPPSEDALVPVVEAVAASRRPIIIAGWGAVVAGARDALVELAEATGALLMTTLRGKGMFDGLPFNAGIAGGLSTPAARAMMAEADCVLAFGAGLGQYTIEGRRLMPEARIVSIDIAPTGLRDGAIVADLFVRGDAGLVASALLQSLRDRSVGPRGFYRTADVAARLSRSYEDDDLPLEAGTLDPRNVMRELDSIIPKDARVVVGAGHFWNMVMQYFGGRQPQLYSSTGLHFGAVGHGLPFAAGAAAAGNSEPVFLIEGDGSMLMTLPELETIARSALRLCICVINDGAYGAEVHKLNSKGLSSTQAVFGTTDIAAVAAALGIRAVRVTRKDGDIGAAVRSFHEGNGAMLIDIRVSHTIPSDLYRKVFFGKVFKEAPARPADMTAAG